MRDLLIGRPDYDHDIATDATPEQVMKVFPRTVPTGIKHGTVTVLSGNKSVEITTFRSDSTYSDARHPDKVTFAKTIDEDLSRRDFTMNGIACNPITRDLIDPFGGREDIRNKIIKSYWA